jgi:hypothetical protein
MKLSFNLLRPQLSPPSAWDKVYKYMVGTARIIVIVVEIVVIVAFAFRVAVDTIGKQLDDVIELKANELAAYTTVEQTYRDIQDKADTYEDIWEQSSNTSTYIAFINSLIKDLNGQVTVQIANNIISISGSLPLRDIDNIESELKARQEGNATSEQSLFSQVIVADVESEGENEFEEANFSINATIKQSETNRQLQ